MSLDTQFLTLLLTLLGAISLACVAAGYPVWTLAPGPWTATPGEATASPLAPARRPSRRPPHATSPDAAVRPARPRVDASVLATRPQATARRRPAVRIGRRVHRLALMSEQANVSERANASGLTWAAGEGIVPPVAHLDRLVMIVADSVARTDIATRCHGAAAQQIDLADYALQNLVDELADILPSLRTTVVAFPRSAPATLSAPRPLALAA